MAGCFDASLKLAEENDWELAIGQYDPDPTDEKGRVYGHAWNVMPDGRIYDATAAQFGLPEPYITTHDDPHYLLDVICER